MHVNRSPVSGRVTSVAYKPGRFLPAYRPESGAVNEQAEVWVDHEGRTAVYRQVVGILARRVVSRVQEGDQLGVGQRVGVMKFGSRMDVFLPPDLLCTSRLATRVVGGGHRAVPVGRTRRPRRSRAAGPRRERRGLRRGVFLLPSLFTLANLFCGWACVVYAMRGQFHTAAPFIGVAIVLDMLDGRIARMTGSSSAFGVEFDSLADLISFGMAPAALTFQWGLAPLGRLGWAVGFIYLAAAAVRLARFNIQPVGRQALFRRPAEPVGGGRFRRRQSSLSGADHRLRAGVSGAGDPAGAGPADGEHDPVSQPQVVRPRHAAFVPRPAAHGARSSRPSPRTRRSRWSSSPTATWPRA